MIKFKSQKVKRKREWKHLLENKNGKIWIVCGTPNESILLNKRNEFITFECTDDLEERVQLPGKYLGKSRWWFS